MFCRGRTVKWWQMSFCVFSDRSTDENANGSVVNSLLRSQESLDLDVKQIWDVCVWAPPVNSIYLQIGQSASTFLLPSTSPLTCLWWCLVHRPVRARVLWATAQWRPERPRLEVTTLTPRAPTSSRAAATGWPPTSWCGWRIPSWTWWDRPASSGASR